MKGSTKTWAIKSFYFGGFFQQVVPQRRNKNTGSSFITGSCLVVSISRGKKSCPFADSGRHSYTFINTKCFEEPLSLDCSGNLNPEKAVTTDTVTPILAAASAGSTQGIHESTLCQHPAQYVMQNQRVSYSMDQYFNPPNYRAYLTSAFLASTSSRAMSFS